MTIYRQNVAIVVLNLAGLILACQRADKYKGWQLPQGGIELNESPLDAMFRELKEEIGTNKVEVIGQLPHTITYDWPSELKYRGYHGQEQYYFLVRLKEEHAVCLSTATSNEFDNFEWLGMGDFSKRIIGFKKDAYMQALEQLSRQFPDTIGP